MDEPGDSRAHGYPPYPARVDGTQRDGEPIENKGESQQDIRVALKAILAPHAEAREEYMAGGPYTGSLTLVRV
jgi:hypothetical protein